MDEDELFYGYREVKPPADPVTRRFRLGRLEYRPCPCGGWLGLDHSRPAECQSLVESHELTARHQAWARESYLHMLIGRELV